jgi:hypothetical protein
MMFHKFTTSCSWTATALKNLVKVPTALTSNTTPISNLLSTIMFKWFVASGSDLRHFILEPVCRQIINKSSMETQADGNLIPVYILGERGVGALDFHMYKLMYFR